MEPHDKPTQDALRNEAIAQAMASSLYLTVKMNDGSHADVLTVALMVMARIIAAVVCEHHVGEAMKGVAEHVPIFEALYRKEAAELADKIKQAEEMSAAAARGGHGDHPVRQ